MESSILNLPELTLFHIFSFLDPHDLMMKVACVCKAWRDKIKADSFWRSLRCVTVDEDLGGGVDFIKMVIQKCPNLRYLQIRSLLSQLKQDFPHVFPLIMKESPLVHLKSLSLIDRCVVLYESYDIEKTLLTILENAPHLKRIKVIGALNKAMLEALSHMKELVSLDVLGYAYEHNLLFSQVFENCPKLEHVKIDFNEYWQPELKNDHFLNKLRLRSSTLRSLSLCLFLSDEDVQNISQLPLLSNLQLRCNKINDRGLQSIKAMTHLHSLCLSNGRNFTSKGFGQFFDGNSLPHLKNLWFNGCFGLNDYSVRALAINCRNLETVCLSFTSEITDTGIDHIVENCQKLRVLRLSYINSDFHFLDNLPSYLPELRCLYFGPVNPVNVTFIEKFTKMHPNFKRQKCVPLKKHIDTPDLFRKHLKCPHQNPVMISYTIGLQEEIVGHVPPGYRINA